MVPTFLGGDPENPVNSLGLDLMTDADVRQYEPGPRERFKALTITGRFVGGQGADRV
jgi:hypothetical protein